MTQFNNNSNKMQCALLNIALDQFAKKIKITNSCEHVLDSKWSKKDVGWLAITSILAPMLVPIVKRGARGYFSCT